MTHSTHFIYCYMASDILLRTILIVRKETYCRHIGYSYRLTAMVLLYAPSHRQDNTYHGLCYTSRGALAGTRNSSMGPPHEGSIRRPTAPWATALPLSYVPLLFFVTFVRLSLLVLIWTVLYVFQKWFEHRLACWRQSQGLPANSRSVNDWRHHDWRHHDLFAAIQWTPTFLTRDHTYTPGLFV